MCKRISLFIIAVILLGFSYSCNKGNPKLFVGGFTKDNENGLFLFDFDRKGNLTLLAQADAGPNPSFFCFSDKHDLIYALNEVKEFNGKHGGGVTTLKYDPATGAIEKKNEIVVPYGGPCHISLSSDKGFLFLANYSSASVAVVKLDGNGIPESVSDSILYVSEAPKVSHPHMISEDPAARHVYMTDLGLDRILIYDLDKSSGKLQPVTNGTIILPDRSGPRHFIFNDDGSKMYLINEPGSSVMVFNVDEAGMLKLAQTLSTVRKKFNGRNSCAEILIGKSGNFLYGSNRGENSVVVYNIGEDGLLNLAGHDTCGGNWPRNFVIDPSGKFLLVGNQRSDNIAVFKINQKTGLPEKPAGQTAMKAPAYLEFWR
ncbi:MAG: lactonase family protein [Bacteroidales bacterium]|jgi:6-phosphogluconolactonase|nr:lactonase family protein [Bacteroidales bacterium]